MNFLDGGKFYILLLLIPAVIALYWYAAAKRRKLTDALLGHQARRPGAVEAAHGKRLFRMIFFLAAMTALVTAAARPWWGTRPVPAATAGRDILILADVSKSMLAADVAPTRLAHAQYLIRELVELNKGDRFGLVAFAGNAFLACPLTSDGAGFLQYAAELGVHSVPLGGTNLERALQTAADAFQAAEGPFRAVVLITDGDELSGDSRKVLSVLKEKKIPLFIFGLGDPQVPALIPEEKGGFKRDSKGELVRSRLAEEPLKKLALETGGIYVRSTAAESGIAPVEQRIRALAPKVSGSGIRSVPVERFTYMLLAALFLLGGFFCVTERKWGAAVLLLAACQLGAAEPPEPAAGEKPLPAVEAEKKPEEKDPVKLYNQALARQQEGKKNFQELYSRAIQFAGEDPAARSRSFFNLGAARHGEAQQEIRQGEGALQAQQLDGAAQSLEKALQSLEESLELYRQALQQSAGDLTAGNNLQHLADDQKHARELLEKIKKLKQQQQSAQQQTRQAQQQNQQGKRSAKQQMDQARKEAESLQKQARELNQQDLEKRAAGAAQDIQKAREAKDRQSAEKSLRDALQKLGDQEKKDQQKKQDQQKQDQQDKPSGQNQPQEQNQPAPASAGDKEPEPRPAKLDKESASKLLEAMAGQEKELREKLKERARRQQYKVEKDW